MAAEGPVALARTLEAGGRALQLRDRTPLGRPRRKRRIRLPAARATVPDAHGRLDAGSPADGRTVAERLPAPGSLAPEHAGGRGAADSSLSGRLAPRRGEHPPAASPTPQAARDEAAVVCRARCRRKAGPVPAGQAAAGDAAVFVVAVAAGRLPAGDLAVAADRLRNGTRLPALRHGGERVRSTVSHGAQEHARMHCPLGQPLADRRDRGNVRRGERVAWSPRCGRHAVGAVDGSAPPDRRRPWNVEARRWARRLPEKRPARRPGMPTLCSPPARFARPSGLRGETIRS